MEDVRVGFYAPDERYWETNSEPSESTRAGYPEGTIEVPLRPDANHVWQDGAWVDNGAPDPEPDARDVRAEGAVRLRLIADAGGYTDEERETWSEQVKQAEAFASDPLAVTPMLDGIASGRGITRADMAAKIMGNAAAFSTAAGAVLGAQGALIEMDPIPADYMSDDYWP